MRTTTVRSRCECQALLVATLNEQRLVTSAVSIDRDGIAEDSPACTMGAQKVRFDVGWLCSVCGRNTLRSFDAESLIWVDAPDPAPAAPPAPAG
jgi:hypothetical protein